MKITALQLVEQEQAKTLKKYGFLDIVSFYYCDNGEKMNLIHADSPQLDDYEKEYLYQAPSVALALAWIRHETGWICTVEYMAGEGYCWRLHAEDKFYALVSGLGSYKSAEQALLKTALSLLEAYGLPIKD
jgi:hypothetical protein